MDVKKFISRAIFVVFNLIMIYYFVRGFLYPSETDFWLVHYGFPILMMEFLGLFVVPMVSTIKRKKEIKSVFFLMLIVFLALGVSHVFYNYIIFLFFVLTVLSKFFLVRGSVNSEKETKLFISIAVALIIGAFLALLFSSVGDSFHEQQELLRNKIIETGTRDGSTISGEIVDNPAFIAAWGVLYYILLTVFVSFDFILPKKSRKSQKIMQGL